MNDPLKQFSILKSEKLTQGERDAMRTKLLTQMDAYSSAHMQHARSSTFGGVLYRYKRGFGFALASVLAVSTGASYAAASALPGDILYPVKIHVNERIEGAVAINPKASAEFAQKQISRRAFEAEVLAKEDRLDDVKKDQLREGTKMHIDAYTQARAKIERKGEREKVEELESKMRRTIKDHERAFSDMGVVAIVSTSTEDGDDDTPSLEGLRGQRSEFFIRPASNKDTRFSSSTLNNMNREEISRPLRLNNEERFRRENRQRENEIKEIIPTKILPVSKGDEEEEEVQTDGVQN